MRMGRRQEFVSLRPVSRKSKVQMETARVRLNAWKPPSQPARKSGGIRSAGTPPPPSPPADSSRLGHGPKQLPGIGGGEAGKGLVVRASATNSPRCDSPTDLIRLPVPCFIRVLQWLIPHAAAESDSPDWATD